MNAIMFDEKNKSAEISVAQLAQTMELGDSYGDMPKNIPMQPGILLQSIHDRIKRFTGVSGVNKPIVIRENYCQVDRKKIKAGGDLQLEDYIIKRFVTKIELPMPAFAGTANQMNPAIALTYAYSDNAKGIQIAFGENVTVCENLSAFGKYHFSTFGGNRLPFDEGMQLLDHWLTNLNPIHNYHIETVQRLIDTPVDKYHLLAVIGDLFQASVCRNNGYNVHAPLNQSQVASMVGGFTKKLMDNHFEMNGWDVVNAGTEVLKPHNSDMLQLLEDTAAFNNFIVDSLKLDIPEPVFG